MNVQTWKKVRPHETVIEHIQMAHGNPVQIVSTIPDGVVYGIREGHILYPVVCQKWLEHHVVAQFFKDWERLQVEACMDTDWEVGQPCRITPVSILPEQGDNAQI